MKGLLLAGGNGTRLYPTTIITSKQLLPVYDKPMIYYPLATLMQLGIRDIAIITTNDSKEAYFRLLDDGKQFGINLTYLIQENPRGIAEAFIIAEQFIARNNVCLILGDNIFHNLDYKKIKRETIFISGAVIFALYHNNPSQYGVIEYCNDNVISIEEKPEKPKSNYIIPGLYFYNDTVIDAAKKLNPSLRAELEITDLNQSYLSSGRLQAVKFSKNVKWFDGGNPDDLLEVSNFVKQKQNRNGNYIACLEEIGYKLGYIDKRHIKNQVPKYCSTKYGKYLERVVNET